MTVRDLQLSSLLSSKTYILLIHIPPFFFFPREVVSRYRDRPHNLGEYHAHLINLKQNICKS